MPECLSNAAVNLAIKNPVDPDHMELCIVYSHETKKTVFKHT